MRPSLDDPAVGELSNVLGGPGGAYARTRAWAPLVVALLIAGVLVALGAGLRAGCAPPDPAGSPDFAPPCFSALPGDYVASGGAVDAWPYGALVGDPSAPLEAGMAAPRYEVEPAHALAGLTLAKAGLVDLAGEDAEDTLWWATLLVGSAMLALLVVVARFRARSLTQRPWDAVLVASAPVVLIGALVDLTLIGVALGVVAALLVRRGSYALAGAFLGLGLGFSWGAWAVLAALLIMLVVGRRALGEVMAFVAATAGAWILVSLPALLTGPDVWLRGWGLVFDSTGEPGSVQALVEAVSDTDVPAYAAVVVPVLALWSVALGVLLVRRGSVPPRIEQVCLLVVAPAVALLGAGPQAALWVLPFAVLARPRVWPLLGWQLVEVAYAAVLWWTTDGLLLRSDVIVEGPLAAATLLRVVALLGFLALVVRDVALPSHDVIGAERRTPVACWT